MSNERAMMYSQGLFSARPAASVGNGYVYFATDTGNLYHSNGSAWTLIAINSAGSGAVSSVFTRTGAVVAVDGDYAGVVATHLTGATAATRYVGGTSTSSPASGTFAVGDFVITQDAHIFVCTSAGSPGTWADAGAYGGGGGVTSFNTRSGAVTLAASDVEGLFTATGQVFQGTGSGTGSLVLPPGYEIGYDQITGNVTVSSSTEASGTAVITCGAHTFDGGAVMAEFFADNVSPAAAGLVIFSLFESTTQIGRIADCRVATTATSWPAFGALRFTPSAGSHTYKVTAFQSGGNGTVTASSGGTAAAVPAFIRFTKV